MNWPYIYTPLIWPAVVLSVLSGALVYYGWRHRSTPSAITFSLLMSATMLFALSSAFLETATQGDLKIFWLKVITVLLPVVMVLGFCFAMDYAGLERWLTPLSLALLFLPALLLVWLILTNDSHHLIWKNLRFEQTLIEERGAGLWTVIGFGYFLSSCHILVLIWLWVRSPRHRWPAALLVLGVLISRGAYLLRGFNQNPISQIDITLLAAILVTLLYGLVFTRFHIFSVVPVGRNTVIERMAESMLVLDAENGVVDLNPAAEKLLKRPRAKTLGVEIAQVLPSIRDLLAPTGGLTVTEVEIPDVVPAGSRIYRLRLTPLKNRRGFQLGSVMFLYDITELKRAQERLLQSQRALATIQERGRVARELHDDLSQELAFINVQAQTAHELWIAGQYEQADAHLLRLAEVARESYASVRDLIAGLLVTLSPDGGFLGMLRGFLEKFGRENDLQVELALSGDPSALTLEPTVEVQLLRILQEALTNIRKHSAARHVQVGLAIARDSFEMVIEDDGVGFEPEHLSDESKHFGLQIMRERAIDIGGALQVSSAPGRGARVCVEVPARLPQEVLL